MSNRLPKTITVYLFGLECIPLSEKWQKSFKADNSIAANNYRPISPLFKFNRIFENLAFTARGWKLSLSKTIYFRHGNMASAKCIQRSMHFSILWISFSQTWISASSRMVYIFLEKGRIPLIIKFFCEKTNFWLSNECPLSGVKTTKVSPFWMVKSVAGEGN